MARQALLALALCLALLSGPVQAKDRKYKQGQEVPIWANKVGPFANPTETYQYFNLPFCHPKEGKEYKPEGLGEVLEGDRLVSTPYKLKFKENKENAPLCTQHLDSEDLDQFRDAVAEDYYFQMLIDGLPIWGFIGKVERLPGKAGDKEGGSEKLSLFTHIHFDILYNKDRVVQVDISTDPSKTVDITSADKEAVDFTYSVAWKETDIPYARRMDKYAKYSFLPQHLEIHWFSIVNSCVTVLLLTGFLATILMRVLKNDFIKYSNMRDDEALEDAEETGWKLVHGDVFRFPPHLNLFCAVVGTGTQILVMALMIFGLSLLGTYYPYNGGAMLTSVVVFYALTAGIAGYVSAALYKIMGGTNWVRNVLTTTMLFCGPLLAMFSYLNSVAWAYGTTAALPFGTIVIIVVIWALVTFPLTVVGGIMGKNTKAEFNAPCRTTKYPREIPPLPWYRQTLPQMLMAGFLPFSAIYIELYYIFASVWGHKVYTIYSILFIVFLILCVVTAFITIALTYFQLAVEDHRWWWRSVMCGGSTALFIYAYCFYYWYARSDMNGLMQASFYFGYMLMVCYGFFLMLGSVGFRASLSFVRHIYKAIKCE
ncbi:phagocytic receptor 1b [Micractinium conductrix]|uniref:Transmembrane 9 superfamily member n=1 Tax=Micractinium conductrix TaxID=554055 RepID=A0A2P6VEV9_9CHLO|nr:phagocytic receptor 1b [Micractinium conductrix]|eukprot:PSC72630.1 phagocytic receptor 1b [Micractinium conductrix]